jgi:hypothetical protein
MISPISSKVISLEPETMSNNTFWHLLLFNNKGESTETIAL